MIWLALAFGLLLFCYLWTLPTWIEMKKRALGDHRPPYL